MTTTQSRMFSVFNYIIYRLTKMPREYVHRIKFVEYDISFFLVWDRRHSVFRSSLIKYKTERNERWYHAIIHRLTGARDTPTNSINM